MRTFSLKNNWKVFGIISIYLIASVFAILYGYNLLPIGISLFLFVLLLAFYRIDWIYYLIIFVTPFSVALRFIYENKDIPVDLYIPSEIFIVILIGLLLFKIIKGEIPGRRYLNHHVTIAIIINLIWILVTSFTSTMPIVSFKFFLSRTWFLAIYFFLTLEFINNNKNVYKFLYLFVIGFIPVVIYSIVRLVNIDIFNKNVAHWVMNPFYSDHTSYGAIIALLLPPVVGLIINKKNNILERVFLFFILLILVVGLILSYTRAAWLSIVFAIMVMLVVLMKIRFSILLILLLFVGLFIYSEWTDIMWLLEKNRKTSSVELVEHVQSVTNISTDMSNLERLNRWSCAIRMFKEKPIFGWGPGTYMFQYAPFQYTSEKTLISTNMSDLGNAHSEYLGPLSESGIFGLLSFLIIVITTVITGLNAYKNTKDKESKVIVFTILLGLCTYYFHGLLNNFLDTDKASALFWGFTAILVVYEKNKNTTKN